MPIMDGISASKSIRALETKERRKKKVPIIIVSGNCNENEK